MVVFGFLLLYKLFPPARIETVCPANQNRRPVAMAQMKTYLKLETLNGELKKHTCRLYHGFA